MKLTKLAAIALAVLTLTAGAAVAMPGNAPDHAGSNDNADQADDHSDDDVADANETDLDDNETADDHDDAAEENETADAADGQEMADQQRNTEQERQGPPADMPSQVPDHVTQIHDLIRQFLNGGLDGSLGQSISDVFGGGQAGHGNGGAGNADNGEAAQSG